MLTVMTELFIKGKSWFAAEILHCWRQYASSSAATSQAFKMTAPPSFGASFVWSFPPPSPVPVHPSVFCLLEAKSSTSASCWQTAGVLFSLTPVSSASSSLSPFLLCFWLTSSWCLWVTAVLCPPLSQVFAVQSQGFPLRLQGFSSSPSPGLCSSLIWPSHDRAAALSMRLGVPLVGTGAPIFSLAALQKLGSM